MNAPYDRHTSSPRHARYGVLVTYMLCCPSACCDSRDRRSAEPSVAQPAATVPGGPVVSTPGGAESTSPFSSSSSSSSSSSPAASAPITQVDQGPALKRCQARNLSTISTWGATIGSFCKQGGCRVMESPAKIYEQLLWCGKDLQGSWGVSLSQPTLKGKKSEDDGPEAVRLTGSLVLVRVSALADGSLVEVELPAPKTLDYSLDWFSGISYRHQLSDLDGDGISELILRQSSYVEEAPENNSTEVTAYRLREGAIEPIPEIADLHAIDTVDADKDGRLDFVLPSPFVTTYPCVSECTYHGPTLLAHTTKEGRTDRGDTTAIEHVRRQCAHPPNDPDSPLDEWYQLACDRLAGDSVGTTLTRLRRSKRAREGSLLTPEQLEAAARRWANAPIPFQITLPQPPSLGR